MVTYQFRSFVGALALAAFCGLFSLSSAAQGDDHAAGASDDGARSDVHVFGGLLFVKHGRVGTRSEGPDYFLQTPRGEYGLVYGQRHPWEHDEALEKLSRKMVAVRGTLEAGTIRVERIEAIETPRLPDPPPAALVEGSGEFAFALIEQLVAEQAQRKEPSGNLAVSPYSISTALAMTYAGARGETATEMAKTLRFSAVPAPLLHDTFADLLSVVNANPRANYFTIHTANRLWAEADFVPEIRPEFREVTSRHYGAEIAPLSFKTDAEAARATINHWINEQTGDKIPKLIPPRGVDNLTRLVLTNAVHFHGFWESAFDERMTKPADFHVSSDETVEVPTMQQQARLPYLEEEELQLVALPVRGEMFSMVFVVPRGSQTLAGVRSRIAGHSFTQLVRRMKPEEVDLHVPRFTIKSSFELAPTLSAMGMPRAFSVEDADFSGINGQKNLYIGKVFHEALVDVNETGVEAAAATAVVVKRKASPAEVTLVRLDRPFVFALRDNRTGSILFLGQVVNPKQ
jgi:serpin B